MARRFEWEWIMENPARNNVENLAFDVGAQLSLLAKELKLSSADERFAQDAVLSLLSDATSLKAETAATASGTELTEGFAFSVALVGEQSELWLRFRAADWLAVAPAFRELFGVSLARLQALEPLWQSTLEPRPPVDFSFRLWPRPASSVVASFDPRVGGTLKAPALIERALELLGMQRSWHGVSAAMARGPEVDELCSFEIALSEAEDAPVVVRLEHNASTEAGLKSALRIGPEVHAARCLELFSAGQPANAIVQTALWFTRASAGRASASTVRLVIPGARRLEGSAFVDLAGPAADLFTAATRALAGVSSVSYSSDGTRTCELATQVSDTTSERLLKLHQTRCGPVERMVTEYEAYPLSLHPFFQRMARSEVNVQHLWIMFSNIYAGLSQHFPRRLARIVFAVDDERIRSILTEQLHEEMGAGDYTRAHRRLFLKLLEALAPWRPATMNERTSAPGVRLSARLEDAYFDSQPYAGVGAAIVIELLGKQVDQFVADQFRRQNKVGLASLEWLTLHETLEIDHASESLDLASFVESEPDRVAAWRGGRAVHTAGWLFFDDMYDLCFAS